MISLRTHNIFDYIIAAVLVATPWIFGFSDIVRAQNLLAICGLSLFFYSLATKYEFSIWKLIPVSTHMALDVIVGLFVMSGPWLFGYRGLLTTGQALVHIVLGLGAVLLVTTTNKSAVLVKVETEYKIDQAA
ncbi:MAG: hypothetical protein AB7P04_05390 [Bacteriovoracia bacterium]